MSTLERRASKLRGSVLLVRVLSEPALIV